MIHLMDRDDTTAPPPLAVLPPRPGVVRSILTLHEDGLDVNDIASRLDLLPAAVRAVLVSPLAHALANRS